MKHVSLRGVAALHDNLRDVSNPLYYKIFSVRVVVSRVLMAIPGAQERRE